MANLRELFFIDEAYEGELTAEDHKSSSNVEITVEDDMYQGKQSGFDSFYASAMDALGGNHAFPEEEFAAAARKAWKAGQNPETFATTYADPGDMDDSDPQPDVGMDMDQFAQGHGEDDYEFPSAVGTDVSPFDMDKDELQNYAKPGQDDSPIEKSYMMDPTPYKGNNPPDQSMTQSTAWNDDEPRDMRRREGRARPGSLLEFFMPEADRPVSRPGGASATYDDSGEYEAEEFQAQFPEEYAELEAELGSAPQGTFIADAQGLIKFGDGDSIYGYLPDQGIWQKMEDEDFYDADAAAGERSADIDKMPTKWDPKQLDKTDDVEGGDPFDTVMGLGEPEEAPVGDAPRKPGYEQGSDPEFDAMMKKLGM